MCPTQAAALRTPPNKTGTLCRLQNTKARKQVYVAIEKSFKNWKNFAAKDDYTCAGGKMNDRVFNIDLEVGETLEIPTDLVTLTY